MIFGLSKFHSGIAFIGFLGEFYTTPVCTRFTGLGEIDGKDSAQIKQQLHLNIFVA